MRGIVSAGGLRAVPPARPRRHRGARSAPAAARAPGRSRRTTRTPPRWASRRPGSRCAAPTDAGVDALWFATADPAYLDKTNATAIHAALRLDARRARARLRRRGALGRRRAAGRARRRAAPRWWSPPTSAPACPTSADESAGGDGAAAVLVGDDGDGAVIAEYLGARRARPRSSSTAGARRATGRSQRVGGALRRDEVRAARRAGVERGAEGGRASTAGPGRPASSSPGMHARAVTAARQAARRPRRRARRRPRRDGRQHRRRAGRRCCSPAVLETASPAQVVALVVARRRRRRAAVPRHRRDRGVPSRPGRSPRRSTPAADLPYGKFLSWRGMVTVEPPRRPEPARVSASAAGRTEDWKFGFVGSRDRVDAARCTCRRRACRWPAARSTTWSRRRWPTREGTIVTFTIDRLAYSPSPPIVFAVVDFDGGGRLPGRAHRRRRRPTCRSATGSR